MRSLGAALAVLLLLAPPALAGDADDVPRLVIDTDMGIDDVVALGLALQHARVRVSAIVACEGVLTLEKCVALLERLLLHLNRRDVPLYDGADAERRPEPVHRGFVTRAVSSVLPATSHRIRRPLDPDAYVEKGAKTTVLLLGPFTSFAAALTEKPDIVKGSERVIAAGPPDGANTRHDVAAFDVVKKSGLAIEFVATSAASQKPPGWSRSLPRFGPGTSVGERLFRLLLEDDAIREHYVTVFPFYDEMAFLYCVDPELFGPVEGKGPRVFAPRDQAEFLAKFRELLVHGRQEPAVAPDAPIHEDVRKRKAAIIEKNGEVEWAAQLLAAAQHERLDVWSVLGVKMGLLATEALNAPRHAVRVVSRSAAAPPVSHLNDGVVAGTGSTADGGLFAREPGPDGSTRVEFSYNGRRLVLELREAYVKRIDEAVALDVWETWHRRALFRTVEVEDLPLK